MTTEIARTEDSRLALALDRAETALAQATDDFERLRIRDEARAAQAAAEVLGRKAIATVASILVHRAEREIAKANPALAPGRPPKDNYVSEKQFSPAPPELQPSTIRAIRAAHAIPDHVFEQAIESAQRRQEPLTRKELTHIARDSRLSTIQAGNAKVVGLPWIGGKSSDAFGGGRFVQSLIPHIPDWAYVEPYFGMGGILLNRPRVHSEIVNDLNDRLVNWWRQIRDNPHEFAHYILTSPALESEYRLARQGLDDPDATPMERARRFHIAVRDSALRSDAKSSFVISLSRGNVECQAWQNSRIQALAERMRYVRVTCRPAVKLLNRIAQEAETVIYVDPPYPSADQTLYHHQHLDVEELAQALKAQKGLVALSGQAGDAWTDLLPGWWEADHDTYRQTPASYADTGPTQHLKARTERLWTNYDPALYFRNGAGYETH